MNIGRYIKELRNSKGISQEELGKIVGVQRAAIQKWENGTTQNLKRTTIQKLALYFDVSPASFVDDNFSYSYESNNVNETNIKPLKGIKIPVLGKVCAGIPIEAVEEIIDYEEITAEQAKTGNFFGLQVNGDSMEPKFSDGDVVIVRKQSHIENGEIAIVLVNGNDATMKKIKKRPDGIMLVPTNQKYEVMFYNNKDIEELPVRIIGKVVELRAKF